MHVGGGRETGNLYGVALGKFIEYFGEYIQDT